MTPAGPPLWRQLQAAAGVLADVCAGRSATAALAAVQTPLRPAAQALAFHGLRQLGRAQALRAQLARRAPPPQADALLCLALGLGWDAQQAPYEVFTLVNQTVEAAKRQPQTAAQSGFLNACLRRFLRERDALVAATSQDPVALWNHPRWWIDRLRKDHPMHWQAILQANNAAAPMTLRVNARHHTAVAYQAALAACQMGATPVGAQGLVLDEACAVQSLPGFAQGEVSVQDAAAQLAAPLLLGGLPTDQRLRILDACAAPGGKTAHLLELADADVTALDIDPARCERIHDTLQRLDLKARVLAADAARPDAWWDGQPFDAILLDAPCTASGIVRRHPDVRWLRRESDVAQLAAVQARLLGVLWPLLRPGGQLLYCTCSVFRAEGEAQIQTFLAHNTEAALQASPGHLMPGAGANANPVPDNLQGDHDGFYYALVHKRAPLHPPAAGD